MIRPRPNKLRLLFVALYGAYVLMSLWLYGIPTKASEVMAVLVVPGLAAAFLYFFYGGVLSNAKKMGRREPPRP